ncbi:MAG TPA: hypothetical protein VMW53_11260 [archaeon]|nr:hypothetical protein [archaeon]
MIIRKHISINKKDDDKIKPFVLKHDGNYSAAIRDIIDIAVDGKIHLDHSENFMLFDSSIANMLLKKTIGIIPEKEILYEIADPAVFGSVSNTMEYFRNKFHELEWGSKFSMNCDNDTTPTTAVLSLENGNYPLLDLSARILSLYLAVEKHLGIEKIDLRSNSIMLTFTLKASEETAVHDLNRHLGFMQDLYSEIEERPNFWMGLVKKYQDSNYRTVAVHIDTFEELLAKKTPVGEIGIELNAKRPVKEIPHREFLNILKDVYETSRVAEHVDIEEDTVKVFHSYRNPKAINTLEKILLNQFKANGHTYAAKSTRNLIIFRHMPEIGMRISKLIENLKKSGSSFDKELITYLTFLNGLKDAPEVGESIRVLGYMMSQHIFREYEKEHDIPEWNLKTFQEAFSILDSKIGRVSEWRSMDEHSICYVVKNCNLVQIGGEFNIDICQLSRGFFKGSLEYAFKDNAEMKIIRLVSHGDDICAVQIILSFDPLTNSH